MKPQDALALLFNTAVKWTHPDAMSQGALPPPASLLKEARDVLRQLVAPGALEIACVQCHGTGTVRRRMGTLQCGACNGTGVSK